MMLPIDPERLNDPRVIERLLKVRNHHWRLVIGEDVVSIVLSTYNPTIVEYALQYALAHMDEATVMSLVETDNMLSAVHDIHKDVIKILEVGEK